MSKRYASAAYAVALALLALSALPCLTAADQPAATSDPPTTDLTITLESAPPQYVPPPTEPDAANGTISSLCDLATGFLGTPYRWGGTTPEAFDCSGFVRFCYAKLGVSLPRTARQQYKAGIKVINGALKAGDLVFFDMMKGYVSHVGMYIGDRKFIHASTPRAGVRIDSIESPKYKRHIVGVRRYVS